MGVRKHEARGVVYWMIDAWLKAPDGTERRYREKRIPSQQQAEMKLAKLRISAYEGENFEARKRTKITVGKLWAEFEGVGKAALKAWITEAGRWKHLEPLFGVKVAAAITLRDVDRYRALRREQKTHRGDLTMPGTRNREVALLRDLLNFAVKRKLLTVNPIAGVEMEDEDNARRTVIDEGALAKLLGVCDEMVGAIILTLIDTGMRRGEVLELRWDQIDLRAGRVTLGVQDTKTRRGRQPRFTNRVIEAVRRLPRNISSPYVFPNPKTGRPYDTTTIYDRFQIAVEAAGVKGSGGEGVWLHDLRRSFVTQSRRRGVPERVIMTMTGHRTRAVFDRYNVVEDGDVDRALESIERGIEAEMTGRIGHDLDTVGDPTHIEKQAKVS
jgi:integrase